MKDEAEKARFLQTCMKHAGNYKIDYVKVGAALDMKPGTASMRITRMNKALKNGEQPSASSVSFLWTCLTVGNGGNLPSIDWKAVGAEMGLKPGTANMRLTRLRKELKELKELDAGTNGSPTSTPKKSTPRTPKKAKVCTADNDDEEGTFAAPTPTKSTVTPKSKGKPTPTSTGSKRKRARGGDSNSESPTSFQSDGNDTSSDEDFANGTTPTSNRRKLTPRKTKFRASEVLSSVIKSEARGSDDDHESSSSDDAGSQISSFSTTRAEGRSVASRRSVARLGSEFSGISGLGRDDHVPFGASALTPGYSVPTPHAGTDGYEDQRFEFDFEHRGKSKSLTPFTPFPMSKSTTSPAATHTALTTQPTAAIKPRSTPAPDARFDAKPIFRSNSVDADDDDAFVDAPEQLEFDAYKEAGVEEGYGFHMNGMGGYGGMGGFYGDEA